MVVVILPAHLGTLASTGRELRLDVRVDADGHVAPRAILDALEALHPALRGTIRDRVTGQRRPLVRFFACEQDVSHDSPDAPLPDAVADGREPFHIVGAIAGG